MTPTATEEVAIAGVPIPKHSRLFLMYGSANQDEKQFEDSDRFDLNRFSHTTSNHLASSTLHKQVGAAQELATC